MKLRSALGAAVLIVACLVAAMVGGGALGAAAAGPNRAVVVADSGTGVVVRGIEFESDSISGLEALQLAGLAPVLQGFDGQGGAVCALQGVGCPSDGSCLTCDPRGYYWAYHRAPAGSASYTYSRAGGGATRVYNGDVEGWKWGTGAAPPYHSVASVFPAPPTPPTTTGDGGGGNGSTNPPPTGSTPAPGATPGVTTAGPGGNAADPENGGTGTATTAPDTTTSTAGSGDGAATADDRGEPAEDEIAFQAAQSSRPADGNGSKGWVASAILFAVTLGMIVALIIRSRRHRRTPAPT